MYELDRPKVLERAEIDLKAVGLDQLKDLGLRGSVNSLTIE